MVVPGFKVRVALGAMRVVVVSSMGLSVEVRVRS